MGLMDMLAVEEGLGMVMRNWEYLEQMELVDGSYKASHYSHKEMQLGMDCRVAVVEVDRYEWFYRVILRSQPRPLYLAEEYKEQIVVSMYCSEQASKAKQIH